MKKFLQIFTGIFLVTSTILVYVAPYFVDKESYRQKLINSVKEQTGREITVNEDMDFSLFPLPVLSLNGVKLKNRSNGKAEYMMEAESAKVFLSPFGIFSEKSAIGKVEFINPVFYFESFTDDKPNWRFEKSGGSGIGISTIGFINAKVRINTGHKENPVERVLYLPSAKLDWGVISSKFSISGQIMMSENAIPLSFNISAESFSEKEAGDFNLSLESDNFNIHAEGKIKNTLTDPIIDAEVKGKITRIEFSPADYFGITRDMIPGININSTISYNDAVDISGKLAVSGNLLSIQEVVFTSAETKGKGSLIGSIGDNSSINVRLDLNQINLDKMLAQSSQEIFKSQDKLSISEDLSMSVLVNIDRLIYRKNAFDKFRLNLVTKEGELEIKSLKFDGLPGGTDIDISGKVYQNKNDNNQNIDIGIRASGKELAPLIELFDTDDTILRKDFFKHPYKLDTNFSFNAGRVYIRKWKLDLGDSYSVGQLVVDKKKKIINSAFKFGKMNLIQIFPEISNEDGNFNFIYGFFNKVRGFNSDWNKIVSSVSAEEISYGDIKISDLKFVGSINEGKVEIENLKGEINGTILEGNLKFDDKELQPHIYASLSLDRLNFDPIYDYIKADLLNSDKIVNFGILKVLSGDLSFKIKEIDFSNIKARNLILSSSFDDKAINVDSLLFDIGDSRIDIKGGVTPSTKPPSFNVIYVIQNAQLNALANNILEIPNLNGLTSISGRIFGYGFTVKDFLENIRIDGNAVSRDVIARGLDLSILRVKLPEQTISKDAEYWLDQLYNPQGEIPVDYVTVVFTYKDKILRIEETKLKNQYFKDGILNFAQNFGDRTINASLSFTLPSVMGDLPVEARITGTVDKPKKEWNKNKIREMWDSYNFANIKKK